jgi:hypothetical protein
MTSNLTKANKNLNLYHFRREKYRKLGCERAYARTQPNFRASVPLNKGEPNLKRNNMKMYSKGTGNV